MSTYLVRVFYLGTNFHGSQWQLGLRTVQGELITAIERWSGETHSPETVELAGRTDKGVHSLGQVLMVQTEKQLNINQINKYLPEDIVLWAHVQAPSEFRPRFGVLMRHYRYYLEDVGNLDVKLIQTGLQHLIGSHDFALLSKPDGNRGTVSTILNASVVKHYNSLIFSFFGTSFLWKLVRKAVAMSVKIGTKEVELNAISNLLNMKQIAGGIKPVPPEGLVLIESVIPIRMIKSKYAMKRIEHYIKSRLSFLRRETATLANLNADFYSDQMFLS